MSKNPLPETPEIGHNAAPERAADAAGNAPVANPAALTVAQLARLLGVAEEKVREHVASGVPTAADGTINLVRYVAWLNRRLKEQDGPEV